MVNKIQQFMWFIKAHEKLLKNLPSDQDLDDGTHPPDTSDTSEINISKLANHLYSITSICSNTGFFPLIQVEKSGTSFIVRSKVQYNRSSIPHFLPTRRNSD
ncbi:hypothetical protein AVEN_242593-1 [Araneus ventricosus]|uniref:Uncharacterized protein n=1 Tax=Araneus ventricosus TaxID=182803 RepID=A0A4Y2ETC4_ARAVE|nr:hypothetical protein AVEN_242593-1 [Araneus ventricosus]